MQNWTTNAQPSPDGAHPSRRQSHLPHAQQSYPAYEPSMALSTDQLPTHSYRNQRFYSPTYEDQPDTGFSVGSTAGSWNDSGSGQVSTAVDYRGYPANNQYTSEWQQPSQPPLHYHAQHGYNSTGELYMPPISYNPINSPYINRFVLPPPPPRTSPTYSPPTTVRRSPESTSPGSQGRHSLAPSPDVSTPFSSQDQSSNATDSFTYQDQVRMFEEATLLPGIIITGPFIPQSMYRPHTTNDRRRYVDEVSLEAPIQFWATEPQECGISLDDAYHSRVRRLKDRDQTVFRSFIGPSISIRLEWPGYRPWSRQIPTKDFRSPPGPITRAKLAKNVAKCVQRFINERQNEVDMDLGVGDPRWKVGESQDRIQLQDLVLVSIHHVSMGSWQPQLRLRRPMN